MKHLVIILVVFSFLFWGCNSSFNPSDLVGDEMNSQRQIEDSAEEPTTGDTTNEGTNEEDGEEPEESNEFDGEEEELAVAPGIHVSRVQIKCTEVASGTWLYKKNGSKNFADLGIISVETIKVPKTGKPTTMIDMDILTVSFTEGEKDGVYLVYVYEKCGKYYRYTITVDGTFTGNEVLSLNDAKTADDDNKSVYKYKI